jgi:hypothetical protein
MSAGRRKGGAGRDLTFVLMHNFDVIGVNTEDPGTNLGILRSLLFYIRNLKNTGVLTGLDALGELVSMNLFLLSPQSYPQAWGKPADA